MRNLCSAVILVIAACFVSNGQTSSDADELTRMLREFLAGASRNDEAVHDRFWADDLIYTGSSGRRIGKADIMRDQRPARASRPDDSSTSFSAEDIRIQQYGTTAVVAFRLVGTTTREGKSFTSNYLNTGTFLKRNGKWQVVSWQATRMPRSDEDAKKEIAAAEEVFQRAMLRADSKSLEAILDESFVWIRDQEQVSRKQLVDGSGIGQLKFPKIAASNAAISVYGDAAVVRAVSPRQYDARDSACTLTFVNKSGEWKIVAMQSSGF